MRACTVRLPGCRNDRATVVFAHAPSIEKGLGRKSPDWWGAFACSTCHDQLDGRSRLMDDPEPVWLRAIFETQNILFREGYLSIK
jgi:hypothetical protein